MAWARSSSRLQLSGKSNSIETGSSARRSSSEVSQYISVTLILLVSSGIEFFEFGAIADFLNVLHLDFIKLLLNGLVGVIDRLLKSPKALIKALYLPIKDSLNAS